MDLHYQDANALPRGRRSALRAVGLGVAALGALPLLADSADAGNTDPAAMLDELVDALIDTAMANRTSGGLYRWEGRYLHGDDQATLMAQVKLVNRRLQRPLTQLRPGLTSRDRWTSEATCSSTS